MPLLCCRFKAGWQPVRHRAEPPPRANNYKCASPGNRGSRVGPASLETQLRAMPNGPSGITKALMPHTCLLYSAAINAQRRRNGRLSSQRISTTPSNSTPLTPHCSAPALR